MIGRICLKLTGRAAGNYCVIVNNLDNNFVLIDGNVKRRKCNMDHLELTDKVVEIKKDASKDEVLNAMSKAGIKVNKKELRRPKKENAKTKK